MMPFRSALALVAAFALAPLVAPRSAQAAPKKVAHVLELAADFDDMPASQALTSLLRLRVGDGGDFALASDGPNLLMVAPAVRCDTRGFDALPYRAQSDRGMDGRCLRSIGAHLGAKHYFWGHLYHEADGQLGVKLHLWAEGEDRSKALGLDGVSRERVVARLYEHLVHPESVADVRVVARPGLEGELWVDGRAQGAYAAATELTLVAGEHAIEVRGGGNVLARGRANVVAGRASEVRLEATPDVRPAGPALPPAPPSTPTPPPAGAWKRPAGFVGLGVGAALVGAGVFASLRVRALHDDFDTERAFVTYRTAATGSQDACDAADEGVVSPQPGAATPGRVRRVCSGLAALQVAQVVLYGAGALAVGTGAYLLATSARPDRTAARAAWSLRPWAGTAGAGVRLDMSF